MSFPVLDENKSTFNAPGKRSFLKTLWKEEKLLVTSNVCNVFHPYKKNFCVKVSFILSSASAFNLDLSKNLSFGKELKHVNFSVHTADTFYTLSIFNPFPNKAWFLLYVLAV